MLCKLRANFHQTKVQKIIRKCAKIAFDGNEWEGAAEKKGQRIYILWELKKVGNNWFTLSVNVINHFLKFHFDTHTIPQRALNSLRCVHL